MKGCIYKITNKINNKIYIGQTTKHPLSRFGRHIASAYEKPNNELHKEIVKYGYNYFLVETLEKEIPIKELNKKEQYYIDKYNPEYNSILLVYKVSGHKEDEILKLNKQGLSIKEISDKVDIGQTSVMKTLHKHGVRKRDTVDKQGAVELYRNGLTAKEVSIELNISSTSVLDALKENNIKVRGKARGVTMLNLQGEKIQSFPSGRQAGIYIAELHAYKNIENCYKNINACCRGHRKTAYGYRWVYREE